MNYALQRASGGRESFHAKVILADDCRAYVGSANVTGWSLDYSMELGFDFDSEQKDPSYDGFLEAACTEGNSFKSLDQLKKDGGLSFAI